MSRRTSPGRARCPLNISCQENEAGRPANASSIVADAIDSGRAMPSSVIILFCTPMRPSESVRVRPRRLGSPTSVPMSGAACPSPFADCSTLSVD